METRMKIGIREIMSSKRQILPFVLLFFFNFQNTAERRKGGKSVSVTASLADTDWQTGSSDVPRHSPGRDTAAACGPSHWPCRNTI